MLVFMLLIHGFSFMKTLRQTAELLEWCKSRITNI